MFGALKSLVAGKVSQFNGNKDFLEGVCAAAALVAYADGDCSDDEASAAIKAIASNPSLSGAFSAHEIEKTMDTMLTRAKGGRMGKAGLYREIEEVLVKDKTGAMPEAVLLTALDVADSGGIDDAETRVLEQVAGKLKLDLKKYL